MIPPEDDAERAGTGWGLLNRPANWPGPKRKVDVQLPTRLIREGINSSPRVNVLSPAAELFYRRLLNVVDDYGRYHASPGTLRGACWPTCPERFTDEDLAEYLIECTKPDSRGRALILVYESDSCYFLQIVDFKQQCRSKSKFPEPDNNCLANVEQLFRTRRRRIPEAKAEAEAHPHPEPELPSLNIPQIDGTAEFPEVLAEIRKHDAAADDYFCRRLMLKVAQESLSNPKFPPAMLDHITDHNVARCVAESYRTGPRSHGTGLLLNRVPNIVFTWSLED